MVKIKFFIFLILFLPLLIYCGVNQYITGSFFQANSSHNFYTIANWILLFNDMKIIGLDTAILQFVAFDGTSYYNDNLIFLTNSYSNILPRMLIAANTTGVKLFIPTYYHTTWFSQGTSDSFLSLNATRNSNVIADLVDNIRIDTNSSFTGWYIPYEVDDVMFVSPANRTKLVNFLNSIANYCKIKTPGKPVSIAPFFSKSLSVSEFKDFWSYILSNTPNIDIVVLQDGVGARGWDVTTILDYYNAIKEVCDSNNKMFWSDLEIFTTNYKPADINRIKNQLLYESLYCQKIVSFEYLFYLNKWYSSDTAKLYTDYSNYYVSNLEDSTPPKVIKAGFVIGYNNKIEVEFNEPINLLNAKQTTNYWIDPPGFYPHNIELISGNFYKVYLNVPAMDTTLFYNLYIKNIEDLYHNKITNNIKVMIGGEYKKEEPAIVYPNPARIDIDSQIIIKPVEEGIKVKIFNFQGKLIEEIKGDLNKEARWNIKNNDKILVSEGIYFYIINKDDKIQKGAFVILNR